MLLRNGERLQIAPQALAELVPQLQTSYYYPDAMGMQLERNYAMYGEIYRTNFMVHSLVNKRANAVARLPLQVWNEQGDTRQLDTTSDYAKLIADPACGYLDPDSFWRWVMCTWDIYGEAYLAIFRRAGQPFMLMPMHPSRVAIKRDPDTGRYRYCFQGGPMSAGDGLIQFDQDDIIPFRTYNPLRLERGLSRLEPLRSSIMTEDSARNAVSAMWQNGGRPSVIIEVEKKLGQTGINNLAAGYQAMHAGSSNAGRALVLEQGTTAKPFQLSPVELEIIRALELSREEACICFDVAPTMMHILEHATFCLPAEAQVSTATGPKPIVDIAAGELVWSYDSESHSLELAPVSWSGKTGELPLYEVRTANRTLRATGNHPVLVGRHKRVPWGKRYRLEGYEYEWVRVDELAVGDLVVAAHGFSDQTKRTHTPTGREVSEELMEFCGILLGDGTVNKNSGVSLAHASDARYIDHYRDCATALFTNRYGLPVVWGAQSDRSSRFASAAVARELEELGFAGNAHTKSVPGWVFECSREMRLAFLRGFIEADGSVDKLGRISFSLCNEHMVHQVRDLMMGLGIPVTNVRHTNYMVKLPDGRPFQSNMWTFTATDPGQNRFIGSWDPQDAQRLNAGKPFAANYYSYAAEHNGNVVEPPAGAQLSRVVAITASDEVVPVYDLTVPGSHSFVADGLVVHNSNVTEQVRDFYRTTMAPVIESLESVLDTHLGQCFGVYQKTKRVARFAVDEVLRADYEQRAEATAKLMQCGVLTPNEGRHHMGLNPHADEIADKLVANSTIQQLGTPLEQIRLMGQIAQDPDGVPLAAPTATNFPSPDGATAHSVPATGGQPKPQQQPGSAGKALDYSRPHLRELRGAIGRGGDIYVLAGRIAAKYPDHLHEILAAVEIAIAEQAKKAA